MKPLLLLSSLLPARAILPTAIVEVNGGIRLLASGASFGVPPASYDDRSSVVYEVALPPDDDRLLCDDTDEGRNHVRSYAKDESVVMLVPRGNCTFERKALNAQRTGASAVIVYGTLGSRYGYNTTESAVEWPVNKRDYDCDNGEAYIPRDVYENELNFEGGYREENDGLLSGDDSNLCRAYSVNGKMNGCGSDKCLVTGRNTTDITAITDDNAGTTTTTTTKYQACCAWDLHIWLYGDSTVQAEEQQEKVSIPAVYITMNEADVLLDMVYGASDRESEIHLNIYQRYVPKYNVSAVLIWAFGVCVAWIASYMSSGEYRRVWKGVVLRRGLESGNDAGADADAPAVVVAGSAGAGRSPARTSSSAISSEERGVYRAPTEQHEQTRIVGRNASSGGEDPESVELTAQHALGFIVMASTSLLVLFFFKIYNVVKIMYAFGCSGAFMQIVVHPGLWWLCSKLRWEKPLRHVEWLTEETADSAADRGGIKGQAIMCLWEFTGPIAPIDLVAFAISYGIGASWLYVAFAIPHPDAIPFYWIMQDIFGMCMCILFLSTIKLNSIKVAAILLVVAFFYDIFFVFVTPLLTKHGESIMVNVATTGGPPKADPSWCEKYPHDADCKGGDPLPMLFAIPRIGDYQGGCSMLGLGDIVLPGLLLSFASRYDEAKRLIGVIGGGSGRMRSNACPDVPDHKSVNPLCKICCCCRRGYFGPIMVAYAIGLAMANAAVYIMQVGQPALLYLVPCCLGTMVCIGYKSGELSELWEGPRVIRAADRLLYGAPRVESGEDEHERALTTENEVPISNESEAELT